MTQHLQVSDNVLRRMAASLHPVSPSEGVKLAEELLSARACIAEARRESFARGVDSVAGRDAELRAELGDAREWVSQQRWSIAGQRVVPAMRKRIEELEAHLGLHVELDGMPLSEREAAPPQRTMGGT